MKTRKGFWRESVVTVFFVVAMVLCVILIAKKGWAENEFSNRSSDWLKSSTGSYTQTPDGTYVSGNGYTQTPNGYVSKQ